MATGKLDQHLIKFIPYDGALIIARKFFGTRVVDIYAGVGAQLPEVKQRICICNCNLSFGWIMELQEETIGGAPLYTVMACNVEGTAYVPYYDVLASDFIAYEPGQKVLLTPYYSMSFLCCTDKSGGAEKVRGCSPLLLPEEITKEDDTWRTTYRVLPWCALTVPTDILPEEWNTRG